MKENNVMNWYARAILEKEIAAAPTGNTMYVCDNDDGQKSRVHK